MIDHDLITTIRAERGLNGLRNRATGFDIAENSAIFGVVTDKRGVLDKFRYSPTIFPYRRLEYQDLFLGWRESL